MSNTYVCTDCILNCRLIKGSITPPRRCPSDGELVNWRIESEDETRARGQVEATRYMEFDRPERKA
jgi:hypothetical protein